jgi:RHS repeat-associated protein
VLSVEAVAAAAAAAAEIPYESPHDLTAAAGQRRVIERERHLYYRDDLGGPLPLGACGARALAHEAYKLALTPGLVAAVYGARVDDAILAAEGGYVRDDAGWWAPSGHAVFDPARFFLPVEAIDPFGQHTRVRYDAYALLPLDVEDPLHNRVTCGARDATGAITQNGNDYRTLAPTLLTDPNRNRTAAAFDALGMVVATAVMGKDGAGEGDTLADPTTRLEYDLHRWRRTGGVQPAFVHTLAREQHGAANPRWQETYSYSDGAGHEVMKKVQAEPGPVPVLDAAGHVVRDAAGAPVTRFEAHRWVGTGRTVLDNKGNPIKQYEPFFSGTYEYEDERELVEWGVTPILHYDPLGRLVRTDQPNGTHARVVFDAWRQETWDENDTVAGTPWLAKKQGGTAVERRCAALALAHAGTPAVAHLDSLGRPFLTIADNGAAGLQPTRVELDLEGNQRAVTDARGNMILRQVFDLIAHPIRAVRADAGPRDASGVQRAVPVATDPDGLRTLLDVTEKPIRSWNERGFALRHRFDALRRPTHAFVRQDAGPEILAERTLYGEAHPEAEARNLRTRTHLAYDGAGVATSTRFDLQGNLVESTRRLAKDYRNTPDWTVLGEVASPASAEAAAAPLLETETFRTTAVHDALDRVISRTTPDGSETWPSYNEAGFLERIEVRIRGAADWTTFVAGIDYDGRGQRLSILYGNGTVTDYAYDAQTFRLLRLRTIRTADNTTLQDLRYEHDPVGNIVAILDAVSFGNPAVSADGLYEYDATYQLVTAEGREHPGQQPTDQDAAMLGLPPAAHPNDWQALRRYRESYTYDAVGNILRLQHEALGAGGPGWARRYAYAPDSNRLLRTSAPGDAADTLSAVYEYDVAGNMTRMPHLPAMAWDHADRLQSANKQVQTTPGPANQVFFTYDASGQRVRKVYEHSALIDERIYLDGYEVYRSRRVAVAQPDLERQTLHVMDDRRRVALIETKTVDTSVPRFTPVPRVRHQVENHLGSSSMEIDSTGGVIGSEEYHPFGTTAFRAADSATDVSPRRYRYTGKERDDETSLYYHGARYYAPWLGRWVASDPAGLMDGPNRYTYVKDAPTNNLDPTGMETVAQPDNPWPMPEKEPQTLGPKAPSSGPHQSQLVRKPWKGHLVDLRYKTTIVVDGEKEKGASWDLVVTKKEGELLWAEGHTEFALKGPNPYQKLNPPMFEITFAHGTGDNQRQYKIPFQGWDFRKLDETKNMKELLETKGAIFDMHRYVEYLQKAYESGEVYSSKGFSLVPYQNERKRHLIPRSKTPLPDFKKEINERDIKKQKPPPKFLPPPRLLVPQRSLLTLNQQQLRRTCANERWSLP